MNKRLIASIATVTAFVVLVAGVALASGDPKVKAEGTEIFLRNSLIQATFHWSADSVSVKSGKPIQFVSVTKGEEPHTITVVNRDELPSTIDEVFNCGVCNKSLKLLDGHPFYDPDGDGGLNKRLDTWFLPAHQSISVKVTAPPGTTLYYLCAIHPWMQARIKVTGD